MEPNELAAQLGVTGKALRAWLRRTYPRSPVELYSRWAMTEAQVAAARAHFGGRRPSGSSATLPARRTSGGPSSSDEAYVLSLCDQVLEAEGRRQNRFDWLVGDPGGSGGRVRLPVDAYYPGHGLVVEYRERQHHEPVSHFDKPDRLTVSGVHRGDQRKLYDKRREQLIPAHGLRLIVLRPEDLASDSRGRLRRDRTSDLQSLRRLLT